MNKVMGICLGFALMGALGASCCKTCHELPPKAEFPTYKYDGILSIVWHKVFHPNTIFNWYTDPIFSENYIIYANKTPGQPSGIRVFHTKTGEDHPAWQKEPALLNDDKLISELCIGKLYKNVLYTSNEKSICATDLNTKHKIWQKYVSNGYSGVHRMSMLGDDPLQIYAYGNVWARTAKLDALTGERTDLVETARDPADNEYNVDDIYIQGLSAWTINPAGDTLLLFMDDSWHFVQIKGRTKAYCYNLTQKKFEWIEEDFAPTEGGYVGNGHPIIIENQKIVFQCVRSLFCFDIITGDLVWKRMPSLPEMEGYPATPVLYADGNLYARCQSGSIRCIEAQTGQVLWVTEKDYIPNPRGRMDIYQNRLYFAAWGENATHWLYCLDARTGKLLWKDKGPMKVVQCGVLIDQKTGYLYACTPWSMFCVDLHKTPTKQ
jgi:outer membrane protein assembly factor BamB